jgi:hypothetical protein
MDLSQFTGDNLEGMPPPWLVAALVEAGGSMSEDLLGVARAWSRPEMSRALLDALAVLESDREREHTAWLLKRTLAVEHAAEVIAIVVDVDEDPQVRSWLIEGYVTRSPDPDDRRKVVVRPTPLAHRRAGELYGPIAAAGAALLDAYTPAELRLLIDFARRSRELQEQHLSQVRHEQTP